MEEREDCQQMLRKDCLLSKDCQQELFSLRAVDLSTGAAQQATALFVERECMSKETKNGGDILL